MNFWQRRRILKGANYLELTPLRRYEHSSDEQKIVTILVPRFESAFLKNMTKSRNKSEFVNFKLDKLGSQTWLFIDGASTVGQVCNRLNDVFGEELVECEARVSKFLTQLYLNKFISFKEIE